MTTKHDTPRPDGAPMRAFGHFLRLLVETTSWRTGLALALTLGASLTEGAGIVLLMPLLGLIGVTLQAGATGDLARWVASVAATFGLRPTLELVLGLFLLVAVVRAVLQRWQGLVNLEVQHAFVASLRQRLYRSIVNANWVFVTRRRSADFVHALTSELDRVGVAAHELLFLIAHALILLIYLGLA